MLSMLEHEKYAIEAMQAGASGYVLKTADQEELLYAIRRTACGEVYLSSQIAFNLLKKGQIPLLLPSPSIKQETPTTLSKRESEVLSLIAGGLTNAEIANKIFTSKRTVESHRQSILEKTGCRNTAALLVHTFKNHMLE